MAENLGCWDAPLSSLEEDLTSWDVPIQSKDEDPKCRNVPLQYEDRYDTGSCNKLYDQKFGVLLDRKFVPTTLGNNEHDLGINSGKTDVSELYFKDNVLSISLNVAPFDAGKPHFETGKTWIAVWFEQEFKDGESLDHTVSMKLWRKYLYPKNYEYPSLEFSVDDTSIHLELSFKKNPDSPNASNLSTQASALMSDKKIKESHNKDSSQQTALTSSSRTDTLETAEKIIDKEYIEKSLKSVKDTKKKNEALLNPVSDLPMQKEVQGPKMKTRSKTKSDELSDDTSSKAEITPQSSTEAKPADKSRKAKEKAALALQGSTAKSATPKKKPPSKTDSNAPRQKPSK